MPIFPELENSLLKFTDKFVLEIRSKAEDLRNILRNSIEWILLECSQINRCSIASVDSSFVLLDSRFGSIYVVQGIAIAYLYKDKISKYIRIADVGTIDVTKLYSKWGLRKIAPKKILALYAQMIELEAICSLLDVSKDIDMVLLDGSALSFLVNKFSKVKEVEIHSNKGIYKVSDIIEKRVKLLSKVIHRSKTLFVAKSSNASFYLEMKYPDIFALELARILNIDPFDKPGFSKPKVIDTSTLSYIHKMSEKELKAFGMEKLTITYVRLREKAPVFQLSIFGNLNDNELKEIVCKLRIWSPMGYPIPLESVHKLSKLNRKTIARILNSFGIPIVSGREAIE